MEDINGCKIKACCKTHWCGILGAVLLVLATILTVMTLSGFGIFGMFITGLLLCCHKNLCSKRCCSNCDCGCNSDSCCQPATSTGCDASIKESITPEKKTASKKSSE